MVMVRGDKAPVKAGRIMFNNGDWVMRVPPFFTEVRLVNLRDIVWVWPPNVGAETTPDKNL